MDIDTWGSPVAQQFDIHSIPYFLIYDKDGKQIASGDQARQWVGQRMK